MSGKRSGTHHDRTSDSPDQEPPPQRPRHDDSSADQGSDDIAAITRGMSIASLLAPAPLPTTGQQYYGYGSYGDQGYGGYSQSQDPQRSQVGPSRQPLVYQQQDYGTVAGYPQSGTSRPSKAGQAGARDYGAYGDDGYAGHSQSQDSQPPQAGPSFQPPVYHGTVQGYQQSGTSRQSTAWQGGLRYSDYADEEDEEGESIQQQDSGAASAAHPPGEPSRFKQIAAAPGGVAPGVGPAGHVCDQCGKECRGTKELRYVQN